MLQIARGLAGKGHPVDLVLVRAEGEYLNEVPPGVRIIDLDRSRVATSLPRLFGYVLRERPNVLLSTLNEANVAALLERLILGRRTRVVVRLANTYSEEFVHGSFKSRLVQRLLKMLLPVADRIVAVSSGVGADVVRELPQIADRVEVISNPVVEYDHAEKSAEDVDHPWFDDADVPVVLAAGRLTIAKDHATLLRAFRLVVDAQPARLVILGQGPERNRLIGLSEDLGVSSHVDLPGFVANPFAFMSRSSVFVLSSRYEGFPKRSGTGNGQRNTRGEFGLQEWSAGDTGGRKVGTTGASRRYQCDGEGHP